MIILWWLFYSLLYSFNLIISPNNIIQTNQIRKDYQGHGIGAIEAFECENARRDFTVITEKN